MALEFATDEEWRKQTHRLGARLHPLTIEQNAITSFKSRTTLVPAFANTIGPAFFTHADYAIGGADGELGRGMQWQGSLAVGYAAARRQPPYSFHLDAHPARASSTSPRSSPGRLVAGGQLMSTDPRAPRLLAVMAHPDDAEILVGGTLFHLKALGWELGIITMTAGDCGSATTPREEIARIRYAEAQAAAAYLGAWYACAGLMDVEVTFTTSRTSAALSTSCGALTPTL